MDNQQNISSLKALCVQTIPSYVSNRNNQIPYSVLTRQSNNIFINIMICAYQKQNAVPFEIVEEQFIC